MSELVAQGILGVAACDNYYLTEEDRPTWEVGAKDGSTQTYPQHVYGLTDWEKYMKNFPKGMRNDAMRRTRRLLDQCTATLPQSKLVKPVVKESIRDKCVKRAHDLGINIDTKYPNQHSLYEERLEKELTLIKEKEFEDYFHIVEDIVNWARSRMLVGPARGSAAGSLVCYLLGITTIDPIPHKLLFERFININRNDLPDIDIDFSDAQRGQVIQYIKDTYGEERVSQLGTVAKFGPKSALNTVGQQVHVPQVED